MESLKLLRLSLVAVWMMTALVSAVELQGQSTALLVAAGMTDPRWMDGLICSGAMADALIGLALWLIPRASVYWFALAGMVLMTLIATALTPHLWLHPLGPLLKNVPIAVILWVLIRSERV